MKKLTLLVLVIAAIATTSCTDSKSRTQQFKEAHTPVFIHNDSIQALSFHSIKANDKDITHLTLKFKLNGKDRTAISTNYKRAYQIEADTANHDVQIGYFILSKEIR